MQFCHVTREPFDLFLGNFDGCNRSELPANCNRLHIFHESQSGYCFAIHGTKTSRDILMDYKEHALLTTENIDLVARLARLREPLFVHCAAGIGRSPTVCVLALAAAGIPPWKAMSQVAEAMWREYSIKHCPSFDCKVLNQIFAFYDEQNA